MRIEMKKEKYKEIEKIVHILRLKVDDYPEINFNKKQFNRFTTLVNIINTTSDVTSIGWDERDE